MVISADTLLVSAPIEIIVKFISHSVNLGR